MKRPAASTIHFYLLVLVILAYPFSIKLSSAVIGVWAVHWLWMLIMGQGHRPDWGWLLLMISVPIVNIISLIYSDNLDYGVYTVVKRLSLLLFPLAFSTLPVWDKQQRDRFFFFAYISALVSALFCFVMACYRYVFFGVSGFFWKDLTAPIDFHPGYFSLFISIAMLWFIHHLVFDTSTKTLLFKVFAVASLLFLSLFMVLLASRLQLLLFYSTLIALSFFYQWRLHKKWVVVLLLFLAASFFVVSKTFIRDRMMNISTITYQLDDPIEKFNELTIRMALAQCSWAVIRENIFLGVGVGDSYDELDKMYRKYDYKFGYMDRQDPHDEYLNAMVANGLAGLVFLAGTLFGSLYLGWKRRDLIHFLFLLFFSISCLFESMLSQQKGIVLFALFNSMFVFSMERLKNSNQISDKHISK